MVITLLVLPAWEPNDSMRSTMSMPSSTRPNTTCRPSSQLVFTVVMKNWEPLESYTRVVQRQKGGASLFQYSAAQRTGPLFAIDRMPSLVCFSEKFSSATQRQHHVSARA